MVLRSRSLLQKHRTQITRKRVQTLKLRGIRAGISLSVPNLQQVRKKIAKCTQPYFKTKFWELIIPTYFTKYIIEMKYSKKIIYIPTKCREKDQ